MPLSNPFALSAAKGLIALTHQALRSSWRRVKFMALSNPFALSAAKGLTPLTHQTLRYAQGERGLVFLALRASRALLALRPLPSSLALRLWPSFLALRPLPALLRRRNERVRAASSAPRSLAKSARVFSHARGDDVAA